MIRRIHHNPNDDRDEEDHRRVIGDYRRDRGFEINGVDEPKTMKELEEQ